MTTGPTFDRAAAADDDGPGADGPAPHTRVDTELRALGWDDHWAAELAGLPGVPGRVVRVDRGRVRVWTTDGPRSATPDVDAAVVTGDWVAVGSEPDAGATLVAAAPRRTALVRRDPADEPTPQVLAANMDHVWVVHAAPQPLRPGWLDRALVVAHGSGAAPLIVITKADLAGDLHAHVDAARALAPATPVVAASAVTGEGLPTLARLLDDGGCAALLGRSGSGKSSLVNALTGAVVEAAGAVRAGDLRGRHTTTRRALARVAGGSVIDTPGVRALGLWDDGRGLDGAFPDIAELAAQCRFTNCSHTHEPDCAVRQARDDDVLPRDRYARYIALSDELVSGT